MVGYSKLFVALWALLVSLSRSRAGGGHLKSTTFLSEKFQLSPGLVINKYYFDVKFPKGHNAVKSFNGEVVDENGRSVPLYDVYLHHWGVAKYFQRKGFNVSLSNVMNALKNKDVIFSGNSGLCQTDILSQYWGLGSETRKTATYIPDPYGIETGNPLLIPAGYEEKWMLNIHAIDTRGVVDKVGCFECRCDLYNVTTLPNGKPLPSGYRGGLSCCDDKYRCRQRKGYKGFERSLYLQYTVKWVDWDTSVFPVKIFVLDVTDSGKRSTDPNVGCQIEYQVPACNHYRRKAGTCIVNNRTTITMPTGGYLIYGVGHQHFGGRGITLTGQDGRVLCSSMPVYGRGKEAGNENGYVVGMSTCYPKPGAAKIMNKEGLVLESRYSNARHHTGIMGFFYILVADHLPSEQH